MRSPELQRFLDRLQEAFVTAELAEPGRAALEKVFARLAARVGERHAPAAEDLPVATMLPGVLAPLLQRDDALGRLAEALADLAPQLGWTTRKITGPTASKGFDAAHANAGLIGPPGMERREDVWLGISLMAPGTRYPDHDHAPEEVYLTLTPGAFLQGEADWLPRKEGQTVYNTPGIRHAMRATDGPFLAIWCLPV